MSRCSFSYMYRSETSICRNKLAGSTWSEERGLSCSCACRRYGQSLGQSKVTSRCSPQHCGQMRPWTAGQKRFSLRTSQIAQLNRRLPFLHYGIVPGDSTIDVRTPIEQLQIADFDSEISTQVALYHAGTHPRRIPVI